MAMRRADVETMLLAGETLELSGHDLRGADLSGLDLTGANLSYARLDGASFRRTVLVGAILWAASAQTADFTAADLTNANLATTDLTGSSLDDAVLVGASLLGTQLSGTSQTGADFTGADMTGATGVTKKQGASVDAIQLTDADNGRTITASPGCEVVLRLPENPSTGYRWEAPNDLVSVTDDYLRADNLGVGGAGERSFTFTTPERTVELTFALRRPWGDGPPDQTFTVTFSLDNA